MDNIEELRKIAKKLKAERTKEWRKRNKERVKEINERYWLKKAREFLKESEEK